MLPETVLFLPRPPSANNLFPTGKNGKRFISPEYKRWREDASFALLTQRRQHHGGEVAVCYEFARVPDKRRRDLGNLEKPVSDLLVSQGVIDDDCLIQEYLLRWTDAVKTGVRVTARSL